jgi:hypothetical protein
MFWSQFSDHHQGSINRTCAITAYQRACIIVFQYVAVCCLHVYTYDVPVCMVFDYVHNDEYIIRHHADWYIVCIDVQTTYSHILEYDDARTLISSNCTSTVD